VLTGQYDRVHPLRDAVTIFHSHLALAVRPQIIQFLVHPDIRNSSDQVMRQHKRQRHQLRRFMTRVTDHNPLIPGSAGIHPLGDIRGLAVNRI